MLAQVKARHASGTIASGKGISLSHACAAHIGPALLQDQSTWHRHSIGLQA